MFPLTRLMIAIGMYVGLQIPIGIASEGLPLTFQNTLFTQVLALLISLLVYAFITRIIERRSFAANGLGRKGIMKGTLAGFSIGAGMMSAVVGILTTAGFYSISSSAWEEPAIGSALLAGLGLFLLVGVFEEVLFRGVLFRILEEGVGSRLALGMTALIFSAVHLMNDNAKFLGALGVAFTGTVLTLAYMLTRNLWMAIGIHWSWNFFMGSIYGLPVSGRDAGNSLLEARIQGSVLWTGGAFGVEAGLAAFLITVIASAVLLAKTIKRVHLVTLRGMQLLAASLAGA